MFRSLAILTGALALLALPAQAAHPDDRQAKEARKITTELEETTHRLVHRVAHRGRHGHHRGRHDPHLRFAFVRLEQQARHLRRHVQRDGWSFARSGRELEALHHSYHRALWQVRGTRAFRHLHRDLDKVGSLIGAGERQLARSAERYDSERRARFAPSCDHREPRGYHARHDVGRSTRYDGVHSARHDPGHRDRRDARPTDRYERRDRDRYERRDRYDPWRVLWELAGLAY